MGCIICNILYTTSFFFIAHMTLQQDRQFFLRTRSVCPSGHRCSSVMVIVMVPWWCLMSLHPPRFEPAVKANIVARHFPTHQFARAILDSLALLKVMFCLSTMVHHHFAPPSRKYIFFFFQAPNTQIKVSTVPGKQSNLTNIFQVG